MAQTFRINAKWDGTPSSHTYSAKVCIISGDLAIAVDAPLQENLQPPAPQSEEMRVQGLADIGTVHLFISSGVAGISEDEIEYLELIIGPFGHYYMIGSSGADDVDDTLVLEDQPVATIDRARKRWSVNVSIPFFYLPAPGEDEEDELQLNWGFNFCASIGEDYMSCCQLPDLERIHFNSFKRLILSDAESQRLRSMSRASITTRFVGSGFHYQAEGMDDNMSISDVLVKARTRMENTVTIDPEIMAKLTSQHLQKDEKIVYAGRFWHREGWSHTRRILILTSAPKLILCDGSAPFSYYKNIPWAMTSPIIPELLQVSRFDLHSTDDSNIIFHFFDEDETDSTQEIINCITQVNTVWCKYVQKNTNDFQLMKKYSKDFRCKKPAQCAIL